MRGGPTTETDAMRCSLDDILGDCAEAHDILRAVITRMAQRARIRAEAYDVIELIRVRGCLYAIQESARAHHPDRRNK